MKLKPLGKKQKYYQRMTLIGAIGAAFSVYFGWGGLFWLFFIAFIVGLALVIDLMMDANLQKYNFKGERHGSDPLVEYEPGDAEYKYEKKWQDEDETLTINVDVEVTSCNDNKVNKIN